MSTAPTLPAAVVAALSEHPVVGGRAQAYCLLTVDDTGFPHVCLLSAREVTPGSGGTVFAVVAAPGTAARLLERRRATLLVVEGTAAHSLRLVLRRSLRHEGVLGAELEVEAHSADDLGIPLWPLLFDVSERLAELEQWDRSGRVLAALAG